MMTKEITSRKIDFSRKTPRNDINKKVPYLGHKYPAQKIAIEK
jgi:hypothetical protein